MRKWKPGEHVLDEVVERHLEAEEFNNREPHAPAVTAQNMETHEHIGNSLRAPIEPNA